ncbi:MAG: uridine diphosphate-N-acetylglucosamine-binding protein YvcK [Oscillospiraceae bacterium]
MTRTKTRIVAVGGGTGLSSMLRGLKAYFSDITAVVTVTDDGGGSGVLRRELHMPPPGDIRNCIQALANAEPVMQEVLNYRFREGTLAGQSLGNLILAALYDTTPSFDVAVAKLGQVLAITGQVLPVTNGNVILEARFGDGAVIRGETAITHYKRITDAVIDRITLEPARPAALPAVLDAIAEADMIVLGPGSLYTSVIPNLLVDGVAEAIRRSRAVKVYVMNVMTQDGETEGYSAAKHVQALQQHGGEELFRYVLLNDRDIPPAIAGKYREENAAPIRSDGSELRAMGLVPVFAPVATWENDLVRHDPAALAFALRGLYYEAAETRTAKQGYRT